MKRRADLVALVSVVWLGAYAWPSAASAQPLGAFRWQLVPYCNVITLNVAVQGTVFTLDGYDDQCGAGQRASVVGTAFPNPDGTIGIGLNVVVAPGGAFVHIDARISLSSLGGPWRDSSGNSGTFAFGMAGDASPGSPPRPVPANGIAPGSITAAQIAPAAIGAHQINVGEVQRRVGEACPAGQFIRAINADGTVVCGLGAQPSQVPTITSVAGHGISGELIDPFAACPQGTRVIGGGYAGVRHNGASRVLGSFPNIGEGDTTGWSVFLLVNVPDGYGDGMVVYAICLPTQ